MTKSFPPSEFIGPQLFQPQAYPAYASSKLCKFIWLPLPVLIVSSMSISTSRSSLSHYPFFLILLFGKIENMAINGKS